MHWRNVNCYGQQILPSNWNIQNFQNKYTKIQKNKWKYTIEIYKLKYTNWNIQLKYTNWNIQNLFENWLKYVMYLYNLKKKKSF